MSTLQGDLGQNESIHLDYDGSSHDGDSSLASEQQIDEKIEQSSEESYEEEEWMGDLCHAICKNKWNDVKEILDEKPNAWTIGINDKERTALHVAAMFGHVTIVKELLKKLTPEFLTTRDSEGYTPLTLACWYSGSAKIAGLLVEKNKELLKIPNLNGRLPVVQAFANNHIEMGRYLYAVTPLECLTDKSGSELIYSCFKQQCFDVALDLIQRCEGLLLVPMDEEGWMPISGIASLNSVIPSPSELVFWKRWIYHYINTPSTKAINHVCVDIRQQDRSHQEDKANNLTQLGHSFASLPPKLINSTYNFVGVNKIQELKLQHAQADALLGLVCKNARKAHQKGILYDALKVAAKEGNAKFISQVSNVYPEVFASRTFLTCLTEALTFRQAKVFNLIYGFRYKNLVINTTTNGNTILHYAARPPPDHIRGRGYTSTLQIQRELQWFKLRETHNNV